jgi:hypothetical protein
MLTGDNAPDVTKGCPMSEGEHGERPPQHDRGGQNLPKISLRPRDPSGERTRKHSPESPLIGDQTPSTSDTIQKSTKFFRLRIAPEQRSKPNRG